MRRPGYDIKLPTKHSTLEGKMLTPFIKWYRDGGCILRGHGLQEDILYLCGDKPARYPVPASRDLTPQYEDGDGLNGWMYFLFCPFKAFM